MIAILAASSALVAFAFLQSTLESGQSAFRAKDWTKAEKYFREFTDAHPQKAAGYKWLGMTYAAQDQFVPAEPLFKRACQLDPKDTDACYYWGRALFSLSRFQEALQAYQSETRPLRAKTLLGIALAQDALGRDSLAEDFYRRAIAAGEARASIDYRTFLRRKAPPGVSSAEISFDARDLPVTVHNGASGRHQLIESMIAGVAILDFDKDGWPDIYICNGAGSPNALLRNNRDGTFTDVAAAAGVEARGYSMGASAIDFDNDGYPDLFVTGVRSNHLFRNRGDGTFEELAFPQDGKWAVAAAWFDYDNDGLPDLFLVHYVDWDPAREPYCGVNGQRQYCHPKEYPPLANSLYRNLGGGKFRDISRDSGIGMYKGKGMGVALGDYDGDGRLDIFVANDTMPNFLFHNLGDGTYQEVALAAAVALNESGDAVSSMGVEFRDFDNDGREDLFVSALSNETFALFRNTGQAAFEDVTARFGVARATLPWTGWSNVMADFNNDGWKDLFVANGHVMDNAEVSSGRASRQPNLLLTNGRRSFSGRTQGIPAFHRGLAWADFDRDGRVDLVVTRLNEPAQILWNRTAGPGNWLALELSGSPSNREAIGAWVEVETESGKQWDRVAGWSGYGCTSSRILHFGIGSAGEAQRIEVHWPSGRITRLSHIESGRTLQVKESESAETSSKP